MSENRLVTTVMEGFYPLPCILFHMDEISMGFGIVARRVRWLAILTGCVAAVTGAVSVGLMFPIYAGFLLAGAIVQPRRQRSGFWLMIVGAFLLGVWVVPIGSAILLSSFMTLHLFHDFNIVAVTLLWSGSLILLVWCVVALAIEGRKLRIF